MMHIFSLKGQTKKLPITEMAAPPVLCISLGAHIGKPAVPTVQVGDRVLKNQLIARADGQFSANLHAPVSGTVKAIVLHSEADGQAVESIVLENDFKEEATARAYRAPSNLKKGELLQAIFDAGIVGEGGAQFPAHVKYNTGNHSIDTFIINGAECEPYLTADYALMHSEAEKLLQAAALIGKLLEAKEIVIGIEKQHRELGTVFQQYFENHAEKIRIQLLPNAYPQGGELQLIRSVTGKELRRGIIPATKGVVVSNVSTVWAIYQALFEQKPSTERIVTLSGDNTAQFGNFRIKIGTPVSHIIDTLGLSERVKKSRIILGGPMMGKELMDLGVAINKGSGGLLLFKEKEMVKNNCIQCGYCVDVCPMYLMPMNFVADYQDQDISALRAGKLDQCIECAACAYICPSNVPLMEAIKWGKHELKKEAAYAVGK